MMDQTAALKLGARRISRASVAIPTKVLIIGQSAGAGSVAAQIFSPMARGLFRAAVMSSGCNFDAASDSPPLAEAENTGLQMQKRLEAASLDAMRQVPADRILALQIGNQVGARVEGVRIRADHRRLCAAAPPAVAGSGAINRVPIIASYNSDDIDRA